jgi:hypothetical protein
MCNSFIRSCLVPGAVVALALTMPGVPAHASTWDEVPAQLRNDPLGDDLNGPCSLCRVNSLKAAKDVAGSGATLELYFDDERHPLSGSLRLTVLLYNGEYHTVTIEGVALAWRQISVVELPPVEGWDWGHDVDYVWVETLPAGTAG